MRTELYSFCTFVLLSFHAAWEFARIPVIVISVSAILVRRRGEVVWSEWAIVSGLCIGNVCRWVDE